MGGGMGSGVARKSVGMVGRAAALLLLVLAVGCSPIVRNAGYVPSDEDLSQINVGVDTRETVAAAVGVPGTGGVVETGGYYYVRSRWETRGPFAPQEVDRQVVAISFGADGTVSNIERFTLADGRVIALSRRVTDTAIRNVSFLRQLLGGLGQFRADQFLN